MHISAKGFEVKKLISVLVLLFSTSMLSMVTMAAPAHADVTAGCTAALSSTRQNIQFKNANGVALSFASLSVIKAENFSNIYCVKFGTSGRTVQRTFAYLHYNLKADGSCPVPGGFGGGEFPWGTGHNKQLYVEPGTCWRAYYSIKYNGDYYLANFMRKRV